MGKLRGFLLNISSIFAIITAIIILLLIQTIEGSPIGLLVQPVPMLIVFGGTFCAAFINFPAQTVVNALKAAVSVFKNETDNTSSVVEEILQLAHFTRRQGIFAINEHIDEIQDNFLRRGMSLLIDINNTQLLYDILSAEISYEEEQELINSRVFEALGGYAPTFGIVGAVLGLIQVMQNLTDTTRLGAGIAIAFVATLYGVGAANIIFLPIAGHLKLKLREKIMLKEIILQGILSIHMSEHPAIIEEKIVAYLKFHNKNCKFLNKNGVNA